MLSDHAVDPVNQQKPAYVVIFFHGYGSNGTLMADYVGSLLGPALPEAKLCFPDGPIVLENQTRSWFDLSDMMKKPHNPDCDIVAQRVTAAAKDVNAYIDRVIAREGISEDRVIIAGFSQGATMAYYAALLRDKPVAGVYSLSGGALEKLGKPLSRPPVMLSAGGQEDHPYCGVPQVMKTLPLLQQMGFRTDSVIIPGQEHDISKTSLQLLAMFSRAMIAQAAYAAAMEQAASAAQKKTRQKPPGFKPL